MNCLIGRSKSKVFGLGFAFILLGSSSCGFGVGLKDAAIGAAEVVAGISVGYCSILIRFAQHCLDSSQYKKESKLNVLASKALSPVLCVSSGFSVGLICDGFRRMIVGRKFCSTASVACGIFGAYPMKRVIDENWEDKGLLMVLLPFFILAELRGENLWK